VLVSAVAFTQDIKSEEVYRRVLPSVVTLTVEKKDGRATGTGFLAFRDGLVLTAFHVIDGAKAAVGKFADGEEFEISGIVDRDAKRDIALVRIKAAGRQVVDVDPTDPQVGQKAFIIGAPRGLEFSISEGLIGQIRQLDSSKLWQFTCPASPGNSGGPLISGSGKVIGIVSWSFRTAEDVNFAVPIVYAQGLDASLPTQPFAQVDWSAIKPATAVKLDLGAVSTIILKARLDANYALEAQFDYNRVITSISTKNLTLPTSVYSAGSTLLKAAEQLEAIESLPEIRVAAKEAATHYRQCADGFKIMIEAALEAMRNGWDAAARNLVSLGYSKFEQTKSPWEELMPKLREALPKSEEQKYHPDLLELILPKDTKRFFLPIVRSLGLRLDLRALPTAIVSLVNKDLSAGKAGVRLADTILEVEGKKISSWSELEKCLEANVGKTIRLKVRRLVGGDATLRVKVPQPAGAG
jgi:S1-C subfamily serine protease